MYPIVLICIIIVVIVVMLTFVIPQFETMFNELGSDLPGATKMAMSLSESLQENWPIYILAVGVVIFIYKFYIL